MRPIYEKLFGTYAETVLHEAEVYNENELRERLRFLPLNQSEECDLLDLIFDYYYRWSIAAFTVGLHLGLSLLYDDVRRTGAQQVQ